MGLAGCMDGSDKFSDTDGKNGTKDSSEVAVEGDTIHIGGSLSLTGDGSRLGNVYKHGYRIAVDEINKNGGVKAGDDETYEFSLILRYDQGPPSKSKEIYQELIYQEDIDFLVGPYTTPNSLPATGIAEKNQVPLVLGGAATPKIFEQGNRWIFGVLPLADQYSDVSVDFTLNRSPKPESAAVLAENGSFSKSMARDAKEKLRKSGIDVAVDEVFPKSTDDLSTQLAKVRDEDVDALILESHQKHSIILARQLKTQKVDVDLAVAGVGAQDESFLDAVGVDAEYIYAPSGWDKNGGYRDPLFGSTSGYIEAMEDRYGTEPDMHAAAATTVIEVYRKAVAETRKLTRGEIRDSIRGLKFENVFGKIRFDDKGVVEKEMFLNQWQPKQQESGGSDDLSLKQVCLRKASRAKPVYPTPPWNDRL
ncbi:MAG: amino acid ABC transporter substrate-binding protein [Halobacteria archaeon]